MLALKQNLKDRAVVSSNMSITPTQMYRESDDECKINTMRQIMNGARGKYKINTRIIQVDTDARKLLR